jgi:hypothetical protein
MKFDLNGKEVNLHFGMLAYEIFIGKLVDFTNAKNSKAFSIVFYAGLCNSAYRSELPEPKFESAFDLCEEIFSLPTMDIQTNIWEEWGKSLANKKLNDLLNGLKEEEDGEKKRTKKTPKTLT